MWKLEHPGFSSEGFFRQARGPLAGKFHGLIPDYDGRARLYAKVVSDRWAARRDELANLYQFSDEQYAAATAVYNRYDRRLSEYLKEREADVKKYLDGLEALAATREDPATRQVPYQLARFQDKENALRGEAKPWLDFVDSLEAGYEEELTGLVEKDQLARQPLPARAKTTLDRIDEWTGWGLAAIGGCLLVGLFTRLANVAGAAFLGLVVLAQPAFPGVFPEPHPSAGHALFVNKEVIELLAMLALACTPVGRWGGLDFFIHHLVMRPIFGRRKSDAPHA
jgi:uncharacterized membrane protein YphA (DoxX/SURF4 family)